MSTSATSRASTRSTRRPLRVGFLLNYLEGGFDGQTARWSDIAQMAEMAEDVGFDSLWIGDRLLIDDGPETIGMWECASMLGALANTTSRIELGTLVIRSILRSPGLVAKIADSVDEISGGRFVLGLGAGSDPGENRRFGYPQDALVGRLEEAVAITHGLLRGGPVSFQGKYYRVEDCELRPRGPRGNDIPLMIASRAPRTRRLAARYADILNTYITYRKGQLAEFERIQKQIDAACEAEGRDPASLERTAFAMVDMVPGVESIVSRLDAYGGPSIQGEPEQIADALRDIGEAGFSHLQVWLTPNTPSGIEAFARVLEVLDRG